MYRKLIPFFRELGGGVNPLWNGLQAYYTADNTPNDALGTYNGTLVNGATYGTGIINNGFSLDGVNDYIQLDSGLNGYSNTEAHSYYCWIKTTTSGRQWVINNGGSTSGTSLVINSGKLNFWFNGGTALVASDGLYNINELTFIGVTYDGAGVVKFYINGILDSTKSTGATTWDALSGSHNPRIGAWFNTSNFFQGVVDEIGIYTGLLSDAKILELYNSGAGKQYPN
jgi:hypothetical protein